MVRTIVHAEDIPDSGRRLRIACGVVVAVVIAMMWGGFIYIAREVMEADQSRYVEPQAGMVVVEADRVIDEVQANGWVPAGLERRTPAQLVSLNLDTSMVMER